MAQTSNATFTALSNASDKALDFIVAIAGWPTVYTVTSTGYTLANLTVGGDALSQFTGQQKLASAPKGAAASCKGRPEEGAQTIGTIAVSILDAKLAGVRVATDLASRQSYLNGTGATTTLTTALTQAATTVVLNDGTNFAAGSVVYIGQECILLGTKSTNTYTGCTRGYRLTSPTAHVGNTTNAVTGATIPGVKVYSFMPSLYRRAIFIFKGYQSQTSTATWLRCFSGVITDDTKKDATVTLIAMAQTWELFASQRKAFNVIDPNAPATLTRIDGIEPEPNVTYTIELVLSGMTTIQLDFPWTFANPLPVVDGHYCVKFKDQWWGIAGNGSVPIDLGGGMTRQGVSLKRSIGETGLEESIAPGSTGAMAWTNANWNENPPVGDEPITFLLKLLMSTDGSGANGTYDVYKSGIGLGIPQDLIDITSFTAIQAQTDYDSTQRIFFLLTQPEDAAKFIEDELCKPFGWYLKTGNDGKISLVRPKNPTSFHIGGVNNKIYFNRPTSGQIWQTTLTTGVYAPTAMCTEIVRAMNATGFTGWTCTYSSTTNFFTVGNATAFDFAGAGMQNARITLGFTAQQTNKTTGVSGAISDTAAGVGPVAANTLTASDIWDVAEISNRGMQIASVQFWANYDFQRDKYRVQTRYIDAETVNLGDSIGAREYIVKSRGLLAINTTGGRGYWSAFRHQISSSPSACGLSPAHPDPTYGYDKTDSWASLFSLMLIDRYKAPPLMFKAKLRWKFNLAECGDVFTVSHSAVGLLMDRELNSDTLSVRNCELVACSPNFRMGYLDVTFLGHRQAL